MLANSLAVVELQQYIHRKDELAFAVHQRGRAIQSLAFFLLRWIFLVPLNAVGCGAQDLIIHHLRPIDRLIEVQGKVLARAFFNRLQEIFLSGMSEAVTHEIGVESAAHSLFADDLLKREKHSRRLAVGNAAVGIAAQVLVGKARHRIFVGRTQILGALLSVIAPGYVPEIKSRAILAVDVIQDFALGVAVDAFIQPGVLKFIIGHHAIPILMAELMLDDLLQEMPTFGHPPSRAAGDECWVLHAAGAQPSSMWRGDHPRLFLRIPTGPWIGTPSRFLPRPPDAPRSVPASSAY